MTAIKDIPFGRPWIDDAERTAVEKVLHGHILTHGPQCKLFEERFQESLGGGYCLSVSSCTAGLHIIYLHYGIGPGDEVIVPAQTHVATAHAVEFTGARAVFVDCDALTGNIDPDKIEAKITANTKAISLVHFLGMPCDMDRINTIAQRHGLFVVEDCALAIGTRYKNIAAGLHGDAAAFSFYPVKHITTAEGGMLVTKHRDLYESFKLLRAFGVDKKHDERDVPGMYDVKLLGYNYRMSELQAALGAVQVNRIADMLARRQNNFRVLHDSLAKHPDMQILTVQNSDQISSHYCLSIVLQNRLASRRTDFVLHLKDRGIGTSIYYPQPVPRMTYYRDKYGYTHEQYPNAARISDQSIALPVGPHLNENDMQYIGEQCLQVCKKLGAD